MRETSSSREELIIAENLVDGSRVASAEVVSSSSSREDLTADNLVSDGTLVEADNLVGAEEEEGEGEEEMEADQQSESRRVLREEEVTSERVDQTVHNLIIDGVKTGEDEAGETGEEEPGRVDQFVASLLAGQHKPGVMSSNNGDKLL